MIVQEMSQFYIHSSTFLYLYNKALRLYIFVCMSAITDQTAEPNGLKFVEGTHWFLGSTKAKKIDIFCLKI